MLVVPGAAAWIPPGAGRFVRFVFSNRWAWAIHQKLSRSQMSHGAIRHIPVSKRWRPLNFTLSFRYFTYFFRIPEESSLEFCRCQTLEGGHGWQHISGLSSWRIMGWAGVSNGGYRNRESDMIINMMFFRIFCLVYFELIVDLTSLRGKYGK